MLSRPGAVIKRNAILCIAARLVKAGRDHGQ